MNTGCAACARRENVRATASAPWIPACRRSLCQYAAPPIANTAESARSVAPESSSESSAWKFPDREAWRNARTSSSCRCVTVSRPSDAPRTRRRARLASCRVASAVLPTIAATSSNGTSKRSCSTNATRSAGCSASTRICMATPIESARIASSSGLSPGAIAAWPRRGSSGVKSSRRLSRRFSASRQTRATTVVSQPSRLATCATSARLMRSQVSCSASSEPAADPSMRNAMRCKRGRAASKRSASPVTFPRSRSVIEPEGV